MFLNSSIKAPRLALLMPASILLFSCQEEGEGEAESAMIARNAQNETRSTIMTSNRLLEEWGKLIADVPTATAILDRAEIIQITGKNYRLKDRACQKEKRSHDMSGEQKTWLVLTRPAVDGFKPTRDTMKKNIKAFSMLLLLGFFLCCGKSPNEPPDDRPWYVLTDESPAWSPDGKQIAYTSGGDGKFGSDHKVEPGLYIVDLATRKRRFVLYGGGASIGSRLESRR